MPGHSRQALSINRNGGGVVAKAVLDGSQHQIKVDSSRTVEDSAFFNPAYAAVSTPVFGTKTS